LVLNNCIFEGNVRYESTIVPISRPGMLSEPISHRRAAVEQGRQQPATEEPCRELLLSLGFIQNRNVDMGGEFTGARTRGVPPVQEAVFRGGFRLSFSDQALGRLGEPAERGTHN
jgi:hypothetical protein